MAAAEVTPQVSVTRSPSFLPCCCHNLPGSWRQRECFHSRAGNPIIILGGGVVVVVVLGDHGRHGNPGWRAVLSRPLHIPEHWELV